MMMNPKASSEAPAVEATFSEVKRGYAESEVRAYLRIARETAEQRGWLHPERADAAPLWVPPEDLTTA